MREQILHTPEGVRDIYGIELGKKSVVENKLKEVFSLYGYQNIQTPTIEYFDVFGKEIGTTPSRELYKFFDRVGDTLVLRPDMTPSIARAASTLFDFSKVPVRLCYKGNTFVNQTSYQGRLNENTQIGAELIGTDTVSADAEMVAMAVESLKNVGLKEFQIHLGSVVFLENLIRDAELKKDPENRLRELIINRNYFGVDELLEQENVKITTKTAFQVLPDLIGGEEVLKEAKKISLNNEVLNEVKRLEELYALLDAYGVSEYVTFDFSMINQYEYYTGLILQGYTYGIGDAIVKGGRYDHLLEKFGRKSPSIGFVIVVDELMNALYRQKIELKYEPKNAYVLYEKSRQNEAISLVKNFRVSGKKTELEEKNPEVSIDAYRERAKQNLCVSMLFLKENGGIDMFNLMTGKMQTLEKKIK